jgi:uncharacterized protein YciI
MSSALALHHTGVASHDRAPELLVVGHAPIVERWAAPGAAPWSNSRMQFDRHTLVLLVRPPDAPALTDEEADELQNRHLAFRADLRDRGYLVGGGPLVDQDDERLRGISIMSCDPETARRLSNEDPAVQAGRLAVQVMTWMVPAGNVRFEDVPAPRSMAEAAGD